MILTVLQMLTLHNNDSPIVELIRPLLRNDGDLRRCIPTRDEGVLAHVDDVATTIRHRKGSHVAIGRHRNSLLDFLSMVCPSESGGGGWQCISYFVPLLNYLR